MPRIVLHHVNSRRFACLCGIVWRWAEHTWGFELDCFCGRKHRRGRRGTRR